MTSKRQILDPICTSCRLVLLYFSDMGTRIRFVNHTVQLVPHHYSERLLYRPLVYGDSRDDMCILFPVIVRFVEMYLLDNTEYNLEPLRLLALYIIKGLSCLEKTYDFDNAVFTLQFMINLLRAGINNTYSTEMLPVHLKDSVSYNLLDVTKIKNWWKYSDIVDIINIFEKCFEAHDKHNNGLVDGYKAAIVEILTTREFEFVKMVNFTDTGLSFS